jgi:hypothetical protein
MIFPPRGWGRDVAPGLAGPRAGQVASQAGLRAGKLFTLFPMSLRAEGEAVSNVDGGDCFGLRPRNDMPIVTEQEQDGEVKAHIIHVAVNLLSLLGKELLEDGLRSH